MQFLTPTQTAILQTLSSGLSISAAADAAGIHRTTVHHWCRTIPEFRDTLDAVKHACIDAVRDAMNELVAPSLAILTQIIHDESASPALRTRTALAVLKFVTSIEKAPSAKGVTAEILSAQATPSEPPAAEIHRNSSLSSPDETDESTQETPSQTPRNAQCPCGSGTKYKRCCGKNAPPVLSRAA